MRISDWSSDVCSSDLIARRPQIFRTGRGITARMIMRNDHRRCIGGKSRDENLSQRQVDEALFARPCAHGAGLAFGIQEQGADMFAALVAEKRPNQLKRPLRYVERQPPRPLRPAEVP